MANIENWEAIVNEADDGSTLTNRELIDEFTMMSERDAKTKHKYARNLEEFCEWHGKPLLAITRRDITRYLADLKTDARRKVITTKVDGVERHVVLRHGKLSASARKGQLAAIREFWRHCARMEYTDRDPTFGVECPRVEHTPGLKIGTDELRRFLNAPGSERDHVQAYLFVYTAQRSNEIRCLRWENIDFRAREITFLVGKNGKTNTIAMHDQLFAALRRWQLAQQRAAETNPAIARALSDPETAYVLLSANGRQLAKSTLAKQVKWRAARAGIASHRPSAKVGSENKSRLSPHALRRSWAYTMRNERGASLGDIAEVLNHASTDTTRKHYAFASSERKRKIMAAFNV